MNTLDIEEQILDDAKSSILKVVDNVVNEIALKSGQAGSYESCKNGMLFLVQAIELLCGSDQINLRVNMKKMVLVRSLSPGGRIHPLLRRCAC